MDDEPRLLRHAGEDGRGVAQRLVPQRRRPHAATRTATTSSSTACRTASAGGARTSRRSRSRPRSTPTRRWPRARPSACRRSWARRRSRSASSRSPATTLDPDRAHRVPHPAGAAVHGAPLRRARRRLPEDRSDHARPQAPAPREPAQRTDLGTARRPGSRSPR